MKLRHFIFFILLALPLLAEAQEKATIKGTIKGTDGFPIEFAHITIPSQNVGTYTNQNGKYTLEVSPGTQIVVNITVVSHEDQTKTVDLKPGETYTLNTRLKNLELEGIEVREDDSKRTTLVALPIESIKVNPNVQQGIESVLTSVAGVRMNNELSSNYSVRGGSFAENLVYVNDIEVYRPFLARSGEQEGLSFPNPDMVGSIYFSAGGFAARYGDKMSSVLDIQYKKPQRFGGSVSASLLGASASLESASKNQKFTQVTGVRYQTNQYLLGSLDSQGDYQPNFTDVQTYWTYDISKKWEVAFLGNYSKNNYKFIPSTRQTDFGNINEALQFTVFFEGQEVTSFETYFGALSTEFKPDEYTRLKFTASAFRTFENETFSILGQYFLDELERDLGQDEFGEVVRNRGVGSYLDHARNRLEATVFSLQHRGYKTIENKYLQWGVSWRGEEIIDHLSEWSYVDSAGYSTPINPRNEIILQDVIKGNNTVMSNRIMGYVQNNWDWLLNDESKLSATVGVRANYWDYNNQTVVSPRGSISWKPRWTKLLNDSTTLSRDVIFYFSTGLYYQPPFYRELRDLQGNLNPEMRAQRAIHYVLGADMNLQIWNRTFKFIAEAYYKDLDDLIPYEVDNVRLRYYGNNDSKGYATGLDLKLNGEFVPGIESWVSLSFLKTEEDLKNDFYYDYYNDEGELISPGFTQNDVAVDSSIVYPGYIPRPTDQLLYFSMFFQDEMPKFPSFKVHLNVLFGTGLPFGPPDYERYKDINRYPAYRRVDIGFSKDLLPKEPGKGLFGNFKTAVISLEVWNLLDINNTISYTWIKESSGRQYGVPNFLTSRRVNLKLAFSF